MKLVEVAPPYVPIKWDDVFQTFLATGMECAELTELDGRKLYNVYVSAKRAVITNGLEDVIRISMKRERLFMMRINHDGA